MFVVTLLLIVDHDEDKTPRTVLAPSFRKVPLQIPGLGFVFRNDEKIVY